jgi:hypothetical protein
MHEPGGARGGQPPSRGDERVGSPAAAALIQVRSVPPSTSSIMIKTTSTAPTRYTITFDATARHACSRGAAASRLGDAD